MLRNQYFGHSAKPTDGSTYRHTLLLSRWKKESETWVQWKNVREKWVEREKKIAWVWWKDSSSRRTQLLRARTRYFLLLDLWLKNHLARSGFFPFQLFPIRPPFPPILEYNKSLKRKTNQTKLDVRRTMDWHSFLLWNLPKREKYQVQEQEYHSTVISLSLSLSYLSQETHVYSTGKPRYFKSWRCIARPQFIQRYQAFATISKPHLK